MSGRASSDEPGRTALSRTGQAVAAWRAGLSRPSTPDGDPDAQARMSEGMRPIRDPVMRAHVEARTRFFDKQVQEAIRRRVDQVVVLGAGYDDRALRFRSAGVHYFELDHPSTQSDKRRRLERMGADLVGLTLVPVDFRRGDTDAVLEACGHRPERPTLFLCEGLLVYLDQDAIVGLLTALRTRATGGSVLAASLAVHAEGMDSGRVLDRANAARPRAGAEPWRTILPPTSHLALVTRSGWRVAESLDDTSYGTGAVPGRSLLVVGRP
ncbi:MAG TPA: class I SAM-dependent methyltransferase [Acidimicrobiales bacterium]|jgi:methyltransferase (TIGR00027 family)|nr:class I SAM-dependent methyltransferase [Acidimicrobiales bacterium]